VGASSPPQLRRRQWLDVNMGRTPVHEREREREKAELVHRALRSELGARRGCSVSSAQRGAQMRRLRNLDRPHEIRASCIPPSPPCSPFVRIWLFGRLL
jgi:hypothetical protein